MKPHSISRLAASAVVALAVLATCSFLTPGCRAAEAQNVAQILHLKPVKTGTITLYYEPAFEPKLETVRTFLKDYQAADAPRAAKVGAVVKRKAEILAEVNRIVGLSAAEAEDAKQEQLADVVLRLQTALNLENATLYLISQETIKKYLKAGGSLPGFTYNPVTGKAAYNFSFDSKSKTDAIDMVWPIENVSQPEAELKGIIQAMNSMKGLGILFHELTEIAIVLHLKPRDPYFRWFSDGFANAITIELLRKYVGDEESTVFARDFNASPYEDLKKHLNLKYWPGLSYAIKTSLQSEDRLENARYAYATLEAGRFIQENGLDKVAPILAKCIAESPNDSRGLCDAIQSVTGYDMETRLAQYQEFGSEAEAKYLYNTAFSTELTAGNAERELVNALRYTEITAGTDLGSYKTAANALLLLGSEGEGVALLAKKLEQLRDNKQEEPYWTLSRFFVVYALKCKQPLQARAAVLKAADVVLEHQPDFAPALEIRKLGQTP